MIDGKAYLPNEAAAKLDALSKAWRKATTKAEKDRIAAEGKEIGESLGWKRDAATGVWYEDATAKANTKNSYASGGSSSGSSGGGNTNSSSNYRTYLTNMANGKDWDGSPVNQGQINWAKDKLAKLDKSGGSSSGSSGGGSTSGS